MFLRTYNNQIDIDSSINTSIDLRDIFVASRNTLSSVLRNYTRITSAHASMMTSDVRSLNLPFHSVNSLNICWCHLGTSKCTDRENKKAFCSAPHTCKPDESMSETFMNLNIIDSVRNCTIYLSHA